MGLVAEYLFDGSARDTSGHGRHGVVHGATLTDDRFGRAGRAYRFNGSADFVEVTPPPPLGRESMSLSAWACFEKRLLTGWTNCIVSQDNGNDDDQSRRIFQLSASHRHVVWHRMICARDPECKPWTRFGEWCHYAATVEGGKHVLYLDGVKQDEVEARFWTHPEEPLYIGRKGSGEKFFFFRGAIDDVRIYDHALSAEEVGALYRENGFTKPARPRNLRRDPISGRWGQNGVNFLDLELGEGGNLTGHVMDGKPERRAQIESGRFDRESGVLELQGCGVHPKSGEPLAYRINGLLDEGEITVTAHFGGWSGNLSFTRNGARWPWRYTVARVLNRGIRRVLGLSPTHGE